MITVLVSPDIKTIVLEVIKTILDSKFLTLKAEFLPPQALSIECLLKSRTRIEF